MVFWRERRLLESYSCQRAELHETTQGAASGLFVRNGMEVMIGDAPLVEVTADDPAAIGVAQQLVAGHVEQSEAKRLRIQEKVRHKQVVTKIRPAENKAVLLTKFLDVMQHHGWFSTLPVASATGCRLGRAVVAWMVLAVPVQAEPEGVMELHGGLSLAAQSSSISWLVSTIVVAVVARWWSRPEARRTTDAFTQTTTAAEETQSVYSGSVGSNSSTVYVSVGGLCFHTSEKCLVRRGGTKVRELTPCMCVG